QPLLLSLACEAVTSDQACHGPMMTDAPASRRPDSPGSDWAIRVRAPVSRWVYGGPDRREPARGPAFGMHVKTAIARPLIAALAAAMLLVVVAPMAPTVQPGPVKVTASETTQAVDGSRDFSIPSNSTHVAIHWTGHPDA